MTEKAKQYVPDAERDQVARRLLSWLNEFPEKPVAEILFNNLYADRVSMGMSSMSGATIEKPYMRGAYKASFPFSILYRIQPGNSTPARLSASELLNRLGDWAAARSKKERPDLGVGKQFVRIVISNRAALVDRYSDGSEDWSILMTMEYNSL